MSKTMVHQTIDTERLKRVNKNRQVQLQRWNYLENEYLKKQGNGNNHKSVIKVKKIEFNKDIILLEAISRNDIREVKELLDEGANPNSATIDGLTGLHQCAIDDFIEIAALLLKYKANVNALDSDLWTPLHAAATCNNGQICILLCKYGADMLALNNDGNMPYEIADDTRVLNIIENEMSRRGITQQQIDDARQVPEQRMLNDIKILLQGKCDLNELDSQGAALIHIACSLGYCEVVQTLLEHRASPSLPDKDGWLPIHLAACWSHVDIVEYLVVFGVDIDVANSSGDTIFDLCEPEIRPRLLYLKEHLSEIKKNYTFNRVPSYKSLRRSRGSSVRRTSVRQKNMLSKKEAKGEFIALTQTITPGQENEQLVAGDGGNHIIPTTIDEGSDVDSVEVSVQSAKVTVNSLKIEDHGNKKISHSPKTTSSKTHILPSGNHSPSLIRTTPDPNIDPIPKSDHNATDPVCSDNKINHTVRQSSLQNVKTDADVDRREKPRYVFSSTTTNWDNAGEQKTRRRHKCCSIL